MGDTWGIPGTDFLRWWGIAMVAVVLAHVLISRLRLPVSTRPARLEPEDVGYLAGGPTRAFQTAVGSLVSSGTVRGGRDNTVVLHPSDTGATGLERAVVTALRAGTDPRKLDEDRHISAELTGIRDRLTEVGLLFPEGRRTLLLGLKVAFGALWLLAVLRVIFGLVGGKEIGFLLFGVTIGAGWLLAMLIFGSAKVPGESRELVLEARIVRPRRNGEVPLNQRAVLVGASGLVVAVGGAAALRILDPLMFSAIGATGGLLSRSDNPASCSAGSPGSSCSGGSTDGGGGGGGCGG